MILMKQWCNLLSKLLTCKLAIQYTTRLNTLYTNTKLISVLISIHPTTAPLSCLHVVFDIAFIYEIIIHIMVNYK